MSSSKSEPGVPRKVVLYGAGNLGSRLAGFLMANGIIVAHFLDKNARPEQTILGLAVLRPDSPLALRNTDIPVVVSIFNHYVCMSDILADLQALGYREIITYLDVHASFYKDLGEDFWLTDGSIFQREARGINQAALLFADDKSLRLFERTIAFRRTRDFASEPAPEPEQHYFPNDVPGWIGDVPLRFIDCGAYTGDTLAEIDARKIKLDVAAAFEPGLVNFSKLATFVRSRRNFLDGTIALWPAAVSGANGTTAFESHGAASKVLPSGDQLVPCVKIDDVAFGVRPTFIKMDVEGSEPDALKGAELTIRAYRPRLAISVYHLPEHLWSIQLLLDSWDLDYNFFLRVHGFQTFDTVLYAVPT